jgi:DNA-binding PadR family transcriptional regulator
MPRSPKRPNALTPTSFHILLALADGPLHGYGIMQRLEEEGLPVGPGTVYGALARMEHSGWVKEASAERARGPTGQRQRYALTRSGLDVLRADAHRVVRAADLIRAHAILGDDGS